MFCFILLNCCENYSKNKSFVPLFSVIIPNYNHGAFLKERIESVLAQTFTDFEIILLDDCSTDNSRNILEAYRVHPRVSCIVYNETNSGSPFRQWEKGVSLANGKWIWFAESDDCCHPDFLLWGAEKIKAFPSAGLVYCDAMIRDHATLTENTFAKEKNSFFGTDKWSADYFSTGKDEINECLGVRCTINNASSALLKKELLRDCITETAGFRFHGDWYCYLAVAAKSDIAYSSLPLNTHRLLTGNIRSKLPEDGKQREECFAILVHLCRNLFPEIDKKTIAKFILLNLNIRLWKQFGIWRAYFRRDKKWAVKVLFVLLKERLPGQKK
jgi:glycosyltransferase involved in cell wall biosynthesis